MFKPNLMPLTYRSKFNASKEKIATCIFIIIVIILFGILNYKYYQHINLLECHVQYLRTNKEQLVSVEKSLNRISELESEILKYNRISLDYKNKIILWSDVLDNIIEVSSSNIDINCISIHDKKILEIQGESTKKLDIVKYVFDLENLSYCKTIDIKSIVKKEDGIFRFEIIAVFIERGANPGEY
ncbi:MAG: hypothetical protein PHI90_02945 [Clostridia bacterium]|nr:hypothetical protein [Clostridia bacterium]MDD4047773.1 hypothetical protein [Clostridia bacterium]